MYIVLDNTRLIGIEGTIYFSTKLNFYFLSFQLNESLIYYIINRLHIDTD